MRRRARSQDGRSRPRRLLFALVALSFGAPARTEPGPSAATGHWSFQPVVRPALPPVERSGWVRNAVDSFVLARLERTRLEPMPDAVRPLLLRRLTLDLTGLPPTPEELEAFVADTSPIAYEKVDDRLFASPRFGEHMARLWLDAARYADTFGLHQDDYQSVWPYRDWVVDAFNRGQTFDRFTVDQLAGDLLPRPRREQLVATGFNRCHVSTNEGGIIDEEFLVRYAVDRTVTTATVWMGLTAGCATCHDHKFDPLSMRDFYSLMAFFDNVDEKGRNGGGPEIEPILRLGEPEEVAELGRLEVEIRRRKEEAAAATGGGAATEDVAALEERLERLRERLPATMIMRERPERRPTHVLLRGQYDQKGEAVTADVPEFLPPLPSEGGANGSDGGRADRLDLARWLLRRDHPLTSRVTVNRLWQHVFGIGIVESADDFGTQGSLPSHPELLDFLASRFVIDGWDVRGLLRLLVTSAAYRQSSRVSPEARRLDPRNRLLSRGSRRRLDGEVIRDSALAVSGLLVERLGGPPVKPYQPDGLWQVVAHQASTTYRYERDSGAALYRRSLYTVWKRAAPPPLMQVFDAPSRESCALRRARTNTPLQALLTMNDVQFVEAARHLAARALERRVSERARLRELFLLALARPPDVREEALMEGSLRRLEALYDARPDLARDLDQVGERPVRSELDSLERAPWTVLASQLLNLDEFLNRE